MSTLSEAEYLKLLDKIAGAKKPSYQPYLDRRRAKDLKDKQNTK